MGSEIVSCLMKCKFKSINFTQLVGEHNEIRTTIQIENLVILSLFPIFLYYLQGISSNRTEDSVPVFWRWI